MRCGTHVAHTHEATHVRVEHWIHSEWTVGWCLCVFTVDNVSIGSLFFTLLHSIYSKPKWHSVGWKKNAVAIARPSSSIHDAHFLCLRICLLLFLFLLLLPFAIWFDFLPFSWFFFVPLPFTFYMLYWTKAALRLVSLPHRCFVLLRSLPLLLLVLAGAATIFLCMNSILL